MKKKKKKIQKPEQMENERLGDDIFHLEPKKIFTPKICYTMIFASFRSYCGNNKTCFMIY